MGPRGSVAVRACPVASLTTDAATTQYTNGLTTSTCPYFWPFARQTRGPYQGQDGSHGVRYSVRISTVPSIRIACAGTGRDEDGAELPDPHRVRQGAGKRMRHIRFDCPADLRDRYLRRYIRAAIELVGTGGADIILR
jgi:hypothetical protein